MYKLHAMSEFGRLYQMSRKGWSKKYAVFLPSVEKWQHEIRKINLPILPDGQVIVDLYITSVDAFGNIITTFPAITTDAKDKG